MANAVHAAQRLSALRQAMTKKPIIRAMECHSGLSALIGEKARATRSDGSVAEFDALWSSSLTSSTIKAKPDIEVVDTTQRLQIVEECLEVTSKPMIYDGDTGGLPEIFKFTVRKLESMGVSAVIIEDKAGLKQNSLFGTDRKQQLADVKEFSHKLLTGVKAKRNPDFMVIARLEALIAGVGEEEALMRAKAYIEDGQVSFSLFWSSYYLWLECKDTKDAFFHPNLFSNVGITDSGFMYLSHPHVHRLTES